MVDEKTKALIEEMKRQANSSAILKHRLYEKNEIWTVNELIYLLERVQQAQGVTNMCINIIEENKTTFIPIVYNEPTFVATKVRGTKVKLSEIYVFEDDEEYAFMYVVEVEQ